jgi:hypothetical protein
MVYERPQAIDGLQECPYLECSKGEHFLRLVSQKKVQRRHERVCVTHGLEPLSASSIIQHDNNPFASARFMATGMAWARNGQLQLVLVCGVTKQAFSLFLYCPVLLAELLVLFATSGFRQLPAGQQAPKVQLQLHTCVTYYCGRASGRSRLPIQSRYMHVAVEACYLCPVSAGCGLRMHEHAQRRQRHAQLAVLPAQCCRSPL